MPCLVIPASRSLTVSSTYPFSNVEGMYLYIGNKWKTKYMNCLYFDVSSIPCALKELHATLVLYKKPILYYNNCKKQIEEYAVSPLLEDFNRHTTYNNMPKYDSSIQETFFIDEKNICEEIEITDIVCDWINGKISNKGLIIYEKQAINNLTNNFSILIVVPFIKIWYTCNFNPEPEIPTIRKVEVSGDVAPDSIYVITVVLSITRECTGYVDNYYVTDEFNNMGNNNTLEVHKTYDIAVVPPIGPNDTEAVNIYGAYKI